MVDLDVSHGRRTLCPVHSDSLPLRASLSQSGAEIDADPLNLGVERLR